MDRIQRASFRAPAAPIDREMLTVGRTRMTACVFAVLIAASVPLAGAGPQAQASNRPFGPGRCGPADPSYVRVANATGGQVLPIGPTEFAAAAPLIGASFETETLFWSTDAFDTAGRTLRIPVDGATSRIAFVLSTDGTIGDVTVTDAHGTVVSEGPGGAVSSFACVRAVIV